MKKIIGLISIVGNTSSHANNIVQTNKIKASSSIGNPLTLLNIISPEKATYTDNVGTLQIAEKQVPFMLKHNGYLFRINANDNTAGSSTYFVGSPRTTTLKLAASF